VHAGRIELEHAVDVRKTPESDARFVGIELDNRHAFDERVEHVGAFGHQPKRALDARLRTAVSVLMAVCGCDDDWLDHGICECEDVGK